MSPGVWKSHLILLVAFLFSPPALAQDGPPNGKAAAEFSNQRKLTIERGRLYLSDSRYKVELELDEPALAIEGTELAEAPTILGVYTAHGLYAVHQSGTIRQLTRTGNAPEIRFADPHLLRTDRGAYRSFAIVEKVTEPGTTSPWMTTFFIFRDDGVLLTYSVRGPNHLDTLGTLSASNGELRIEGTAFVTPERQFGTRVPPALTPLPLLKSNWVLHIPTRIFPSQFQARSRQRLTLREIELLSGLQQSVTGSSFGTLLLQSKEELQRVANWGHHAPSLRAGGRPVTTLAIKLPENFDEPALFDKFLREHNALKKIVLDQAVFLAKAIDNQRFHLYYIPLGRSDLLDAVFRHEARSPIAFGWTARFSARTRAYFSEIGSDEYADQFASEAERFTALRSELEGLKQAPGESLTISAEIKASIGIGKSLPLVRSLVQEPLFLLNLSDMDWDKYLDITEQVIEKAAQPFYLLVREFGQEKFYYVDPKARPDFFLELIDCSGTLDGTRLEGSKT